MVKDNVCIHTSFQKKASGPAAHTAEWRDEIMLISTIRNPYSHNKIMPRLLDLVIDGRCSRHHRISIGPG